MSELANESAVLDIYSQYKRSRDVIDLELYLDLRESARDAIELKQREHEIQQILKMATNARAAGETVKPAAFSSASGQVSAESSDFDFIVSVRKLSKKVADFVRPSNLMSSPMRGMSMVAGAAIVALGLGLFGSAVFKPGIDAYPKSNYVADVFLENAHLVDQLIVGNQEWQYGFSANTGPAAKAFQAGELAVDLSVIGQSVSADGAMRAGGGVNISEQSGETIAQRLRAHTPYADESVDISMISSSTARKIESELAAYYSKEDSQAQMFQFGQWLEYHYLLSRLAVVDGRVAVYQNNYRQHQNLLNKLETHLRAKNLLSEDDIVRMKELPALSLTLENVDQISILLLKIKSVLSYG